MAAATITSMGIKENTVRTAIVDKNGKQTTVHKKASDTSAASKRLGSIAPTLGSSKTPKAYKPVKSQLEVKSRAFVLYPKKIDPGFIVSSRSLNGSGNAKFHKTLDDKTTYEILGKVRDTNNAIAVMYSGVGNPDNVEEFLEKRGMEHLKADRSDMMQRAFERRIDATSFASFDQSYSHWSDGSDRYLDAAEAYSYPSLRNVAPGSGIHLDILEDRVSIADLKTLGVQVYARAQLKYELKELLAGVHAGTAPFTAEELSKAFKQTKNLHGEQIMTKLLKAHGGEFVASIRDMDLALDIVRYCEQQDDPDWRSAITYADEFRSRQFRNHAEVYQLYKHGVDLDFAVEKSKNFDEYKVRDIAALHAGIAPAVTDGWL